MNLAMISDRMIQSLYFTLIHSLWQGPLLAVVVGLLLTVTPATCRPGKGGTTC